MLAEIVIDSDGNIFFYNEKDRYHRIGGPAIDLQIGHKEWHINGKYHRLDGPAIEFHDGTKLWWINGKRHSKKDFNKRVRNSPV